MYPNDAHPDDGTFVAAQVESLRDIGIDVELLFASTAWWRGDRSTGASERPFGPA